MSIINNGRGPKQRIGALMSQYGIMETSIARHEEITTSDQAICYIFQKMKTSSKYSTASTLTAIAVNGAAAFGIGIATGGLGLAVVAGAALGAGAGVVQGQTSDKFSTWGLGKCARGVKALYKTARGTKGVHRRQASRALVEKAKNGWISQNWDRENTLAYHTLDALIGDGRYTEGLISFAAMNDNIDSVSIIVEKMLKS